MRRRFATFVLPILVVGLIPAAVLAGSPSVAPPSDARARHEAAVAFWTADRIRAAIPLDVVLDPAPDAGAAGLPAAAGGLKGKPKPKPTPTPTPTPGPTPTP